MSSSAVPGSGPGPQEGSVSSAYTSIAAEPDFARLKTAFARFAFPVTAAFLSWYLLYVLMSAWARGVMDTKLVGNINLALVFGLLQFVSTFVITWLYGRHMSRHVDPLADRLLAAHEELSASASSVDLRGTTTGPEVTR
ncbi:MAG: DUF485 domain-containing protein [Kineosporiaceae bacterium]